MEDVKNKRCPFRVCKIEHPPILRGQGAAVTEEFYNCMGEECAAYYKGGCMRLIPPVLEIDAKEISYADLEKLWEEMRNAPIMAAPGSAPSVCVVQEKAPVRDCSNCAVIFGEPCVKCVRSDEPGTTPSNWEPMEVQK